MLKIFIYITLGFLPIACGSSKKSASTLELKDSYKQIVENKLGENVLYINNKSNSHILCINETKGTTLQPRNTINYLVLKKSDNSVILNSSINGGTVSWYNQKMIQVYRTPGIMRDDQTSDNFITLYNVETGKSYPKNQKQTH